jgi:ribulose-5-phosphate 4-epimerase/fuculose-1-phosphate aldolase
MKLAMCFDQPIKLIGLAPVVMLALLFGLTPARAQTSVAPFPSDAAALIDDIVIGSRILAEFGVLDGFGHVSARDPANPNHFLMSRSLAPALVTAGDIMVFDLDGNAIDNGSRSVFLERFIHSEIYKARPDVMAVVHTHSPGVIPFSVSQVPLRAIYHNAAFLAVGAPVWDIRKDFGETDMLVRDGARGKSLAQVLGDKSVVLMRGHGDVTVGPSVKLAVFRAYYTDVDARLQSQAIALGGNQLSDAGRGRQSRRHQSGRPRPHLEPVEDAYRANAREIIARRFAAKGTKLWAGDRVASELTGSTPETETRLSRAGLDHVLVKPQPSGQ